MSNADDLELQAANSLPLPSDSDDDIVSSPAAASGTAPALAGASVSALSVGASISALAAAAASVLSAGASSSALVGGASALHDAPALDDGDDDAPYRSPLVFRIPHLGAFWMSVFKATAVAPVVLASNLISLI